MAEAYTETQHVYIVGSKGIPARYGGFETFVDKLTELRVSDNIRYHVASMRGNSELSENADRFEYNQADVFSITVPNVGPARAIVYDMQALSFAIRDATENGYSHPIFYILASRIGPFLSSYSKKIHKIGGRVFLNPDGHEWKRQKWSAPVRKYWKFSEYGMIKFSDFIVADNPKIQEYVENDYSRLKPDTRFIAYGTDLTPSNLRVDDDVIKDWYKKHNVKINDYYLIVGRFVPENNYETMIREFLNSNTDKQLVIVTNIEQNSFYKQLDKKTGFSTNPRINFVGTVYDQQLLKFIRQNAYGYFHGHAVGGTNPSLLEAMATTKLNMLVDVDFNRAVAEESALYWNLADGNLSQLIDYADSLTVEEREALGKSVFDRVSTNFAWYKIVNQYEELFLTENK